MCVQATWGRLQQRNTTWRLGYRDKENIEKWRHAATARATRPSGQRFDTGKPNEPTKYLHTLNSTLVATERAIVAILENFQKPDGMIEIPLVLQKYMGGQEVIPGPMVMLN